MRSNANDPPALVRRLEERDVEGVAVLFEEDMKALGVNTPRRRLIKLMQKVFEDDGQSCLCWIAESEAPTFPFGAILVNLYNSITFGGPSLWIEGLYVNPLHRRKGIGRLLVEHVIDWAAPRDFYGVDLEAYHGNTPAAILYRSLGFRRLGRERFSLSAEDMKD